MEEERKVFSFGVEELAEAEELNARANTRMTEEYKEFLRQQYGDDEDFPEYESDRADSFPKNESGGDMRRFNIGLPKDESGEDYDCPTDIPGEDNGCDEDVTCEDDGCNEDVICEDDGCTGDVICEEDDCTEDVICEDDGCTEDVTCEDDGCGEDVTYKNSGCTEDITGIDDCPEEQSVPDDFYPDDEPGFD